MDIRFEGFEDTREWATTFELFEIDGEPVYVYERPVYINERKPGTFDIVVFTGRRWMATHTGKAQNSRILDDSGVRLTSLCLLRI